MTMPINLVLVRHGESEGNIANKKSRAGDHSLFTEEFMRRHNSTWRLTEKGRLQAEAARDWLRENFPDTFDRCYVSEYARAQETAGIISPKARDDWRTSIMLRERDWGQLDSLSDEERKARFTEALQKRQRDGLYWYPPGGESLAKLCERIYMFFGKLHRECTDKNVIIVCHGEVMWIFRFLLEQMTQERFFELDRSKDPYVHIHNCQIIHYTRRDPASSLVTTKYEWMRSISPTDLPLCNQEWQRIVRQKFTSAELLDNVSKFERMID